MAVLRSGRRAWRRWVSQTLDDRDRRRDGREALLLLAAMLFVFANAIAYSLVREAGLRWAHLAAPLVWLAMVALAHGALRTFRPRRDPFLLPVFALLSGWGLLLQDRLAPNFWGGRRCGFRWRRWPCWPSPFCPARCNRCAVTVT